jgi:hypothetical protein
MLIIGPFINAIFFLYSGESLDSSFPGGWGCDVDGFGGLDLIGEAGVPVRDFRGERALARP